jgi:SAM-dependent methyltransferase
VAIARDCSRLSAEAAGRDGPFPDGRSGRGRRLYSAGVADSPFTLADPALAARLARVMDPEGKIERALDAIAGLAGRDVLVVGPARGRRPAQLRAMGANVMTAPLSRLHGVAALSADAVIACWTALDRPEPAAERGHAAAGRILRPGGRLLLLADYGRDDVAGLSSDANPAEEHDRMRGRDTWFAARGFKLHVIHAWWRFESVEAAREFLGAAFGERGLAVADGMRRPRLAHKLVVYHRTFDSGGMA